MTLPRVDVLVPVLGRPHRVLPTLESIRATAPDAHVLFIPDPDDEAELNALRRAGAAFSAHAGGYAAKINYGVRITHAPTIFLGADDLEWHPGWLEACLEHVDDGAQVVGVNDLCTRRVRRGEHATHFLITRRYATERTIDGSPGPLFEGYDHSCVDDELVATARRRGVLVIDSAIVVEHHHAINGRAPDDETYRKGRARLEQDRDLFIARSHLWM
ncbi:MAG: glycosyltransferase [Patulibacter minatonensis]